MKSVYGIGCCKADIDNFNEILEDEYSVMKNNFEVKRRDNLEIDGSIGEIYHVLTDNVCFSDEVAQESFQRIADERAEIDELMEEFNEIQRKILEIRAVWEHKKSEVAALREYNNQCNAALGNAKTMSVTLADDSEEAKRLYNEQCRARDAMVREAMINSASSQKELNNAERMLKKIGAALQRVGAKNEKMEEIRYELETGLPNDIIGQESSIKGNLDRYNYEMDSIRQKIKDKICTAENFFDFYKKAHGKAYEKLSMAEKIGRTLSGISDADFDSDTHIYVWDSDCLSDYGSLLSRSEENIQSVKSRLNAAGSKIESELESNVTKESVKLIRSALRIIDNVTDDFNDIKGSLNKAANAIKAYNDR